MNFSIFRSLNTKIDLLKWLKMFKICSKFVQNLIYKVILLDIKNNNLATEPGLSRNTRSSGMKTSGMRMSGMRISGWRTEGPSAKGERPSSTTIDDFRTRMTVFRNFGDNLGRRPLKAFEWGQKS